MKMLKEAEAAEIVGVSVRTLQTWRVEGRGPKYAKLGLRAVRYDKDLLEDWLRKRTVQSTAEANALD